MPVAQAKARFRLRTILLVVNMFVLIVSIASIYGFRLYENELVRETESELIAQGAYISAMYKQALTPLTQHNAAYGLPVQNPLPRSDEKYDVINPTLELGQAEILSKRPDAAETDVKPDPLASKAAQVIFPTINEATLTTLAGVLIVDYQGIVVAGRAEVGQSLAHIEEVAAALTGHYNAKLRARNSDHQDPPLTSISRGARIRAFVAMPIIQNDRVVGAVLLSRSPRNILKGLYDERHHVLIAGGIILGITVLLALLTSYAIARPIHALIGQTQRIARGEKDISPIDEPVTQELALLSDNITSMAHTIAERSDYIRNFAMHVSHEFKTPLTAIQGAIELIQEHGNSMPPEQFQKFLTNVTKDTDRLKTLVSRLLELARADVMQAKDETTDVAALITNMQKCYAGSVVMEQIKQPCIANVASDVLETVLVNLVENSLQHGAKQIRIGVSTLNNYIAIDVKDDGVGISEGNRSKLFTPFFTTKRENGGTGLGLVISRSLLRAFDADIECIPAEKGAHFRILIPFLIHHMTEAA